MHRFLANNRSELIARCTAAVAQRRSRKATADQLKNGIPMFLDQLIRTLRAEEGGDEVRSAAISGAKGGDATALSEIGVSATAHGKALLQLGYSVDQVVHDYGDLCQAITTLAVERDAPFGVDEFRTLNRCLDNAIADAVVEFGAERDASIARGQLADRNESLGFLVHEVRNAVHTATLAVRALETSNLPISGATGNLLKRSLAAVSSLLETAMSELRAESPSPHREVFSLAAFISEAEQIAGLQALGQGCRFVVSDVDPEIALSGERQLLLGAVINLLQNAFKFTRPHTAVSLRAYASGSRAFITIKDHCGGLPSGVATSIFQAFYKAGADQSGLGLGLTIARRSVEADGGKLMVLDLPGEGCIFTVDMPRFTFR
ncbi:MAG: HAMP domain-containing histidine kinase [Comamonadaceae bacterium]|nr:MAG: HAMP domain-containing histidine kinase [Comamonadaceae bacterium]